MMRLSFDSEPSRFHTVHSSLSAVASEGDWMNLILSGFGFQRQTWVTAEGKRLPTVE